MAGTSAFFFCAFSWSPVCLLRLFRFPSVLNRTFSPFLMETDFLLVFVVFAVTELLNMACSSVMPGGGTNLELALHCLHEARGNVLVRSSYLVIINNGLRRPVMCVWEAHLTHGVRWEPLPVFYSTGWTLVSWLNLQSSCVLPVAAACTNVSWDYRPCPGVCIRASFVSCKLRDNSETISTTPPNAGSEGIAILDKTRGLL